MRDSTIFSCLGAIGLAALLSPSQAHAQGGFQACLQGLRSTALSQGISAATFDAHAANLQPNNAYEFLDKQPEFKTPIWDYMSGLVDEERVSEGRSKLSQHASALATAEGRYGVDRQTIVAVWGVESNYGKNFGKMPLLQSLATLSCIGRRQGYFRVGR